MRNIRRHEIKSWPAPFKAVLSGRKRFEVRKADRDYKPGDLLELTEWDPDRCERAGGAEKEGYTGRTIGMFIGHIESGPFMPEGWVGLQLVDPEELERARVAFDGMVRGVKLHDWIVNAGAAALVLVLLGVLFAGCGSVTSSGVLTDDDAGGAAGDMGVSPFGGMGGDGAPGGAGGAPGPAGGSGGSAPAWPPASCSTPATVVYLCSPSVALHGVPCNRCYATSAAASDVSVNGPCTTPAAAGVCVRNCLDCE